MGSLKNYGLEPRGPTPYPYAKFQPHTSKHDETQSWTHMQTQLFSSTRAPVAAYTKATLATFG